MTPTLRTRLSLGMLILALLGLTWLTAPALGIFGTMPFVDYPAANPHPRTVAVMFSGDMGFRFGKGRKIAAALAAKGIPVLGVSSPVVFGMHRTRAEVDAIVAGATRLALARTGAQRVLLMSQSYGADILATAAPDLPADLRPRVAAIQLTVPALDVYFRADPAGLAYLGTPDARPMEALRQLKWAPVMCVYGLQEKGSLCPAMHGHAQVIGLPGDHYLGHDCKRVIATILHSLKVAVPDIGLRP